ncbi:MAG TPA: hypothetical protein VGX21_22580 [Methylomirabilota bacterium]|jgi:hypothetical protein|nr:hypothetical protein [Methylomirabilota bacterium]
MHRIALALALAALLAGCALTPVRLQHPQTGEVRQCTGHYWSWGYFIAASMQDDCAKQLEAAGYRRLP